MLAKEKSKLDARLKPLISQMTWDKYDKDYIEETFGMIRDYHSRVMKAQANVQKILSNINAWGEVPLFTRKDNLIDSLLDIANRGTAINSRLNRCLLSNRLIEKVILDENYRLYFNVPASCPCSSGSESSDEEDDDYNDSRRTTSKRQQTITESLGDINRLREPFTTTLVFKEDDAKLYLPYQEYIDVLVGKEIMSAIHTRFERQKIKKNILSNAFSKN